MRSFVVGFLFSEDGKHVALIEKAKPEWQKGLYNGIGGKIEPEEQPLDAMIREFQEETGVRFEDWTRFLTMANSEFVCYCFRGFSDKVFDVRTTTDEPVKVFEVANLPDNLISNLRWLTPMAAHRTSSEDYEIRGKVRAA